MSSPSARTLLRSRSRIASKLGSLAIEGLHEFSGSLHTALLKLARVRLVGSEHESRHLPRPLRPVEPAEDEGAEAVEVTGDGVGVWEATGRKRYDVQSFQRVGVAVITEQLARLLARSSK